MSIQRKISRRKWRHGQMMRALNVLDGFVEHFADALANDYAPFNERIQMEADGEPVRLHNEAGAFLLELQKLVRNPRLAQTPMELAAVKYLRPAIWRACKRDSQTRGNH